MKLSELKSIIQESVKQALTEVKYGTLTVKNQSQLNLFNAEILGQLFLVNFNHKERKLKTKTNI